MRTERWPFVLCCLLMEIGCAASPDACERQTPAAQLHPSPTGRALSGHPTQGLCVSAVYYCSADGPTPQGAPPGYVSAPSDPPGCDFNRCDGTTCQQNFCRDCGGDCAGCLPPNPCQWSVPLSLLERRPQVTHLGDKTVQGVCALTIYYCGPGNNTLEQPPPPRFQAAPSDPPGCGDNSCVGRICRQVFCRDCGGDCSKSCG